VKLAGRLGLGLTWDLFAGESSITPIGLAKNAQRIFFDIGYQEKNIGEPLAAKQKYCSGAVNFASMVIHYRVSRFLFNLGVLTYQNGA
jgi:hypothetical protein